MQTGRVQSKDMDTNFEEQNARHQRAIDHKVLRISITDRKTTNIDDITERLVSPK